MLIKIIRLTVQEATECLVATETASDIRTFTNVEFGSVRIVVKDGEPWFVGKDVTDILGYKNSRDAFAKHIDDEDRGVANCDTLGGKQKVITINESGLYSLIMSSKLPTAKKFKRWVIGEVLPSIRKNGGYIAEKRKVPHTKPKRCRTIQKLSQLV